jgi:ATP-binding cassette subfamily F protein uup
VLEDRLTEYSGTLIVVSHDREFLDNVVTSTVVFESDGSVQEYVGGYSDWLRQGHELAITDSPFEIEERKRLAAEKRKQKKPKKLSYKDQRELDQLPAEIEVLESMIKDIQTNIADPGFYVQEQPVVQAKLQELTANEALLESRVERWSELEDLQADLRS